MNGGDDRDEADELARLDALFLSDPGPSGQELAEARLLLKRSLAREREGRGEPTQLRLASRRVARVWLQAAGFVLLVAALSPFVPRFFQNETRPTVDVVASLADEARSVGARLKPWLPPLPSLPTIPSLSSLPKRPLFDWIPTRSELLHSDAR